MSTPRHASHVPEADAAVARVLEAERAARARVTACEQEAADIVKDASTRAAALRTRTERRIELISQKMQAQTEGRLQAIQLERDRLAAGPGIDPGMVARLHKAIDGLITDIAGDADHAGKA